jgi:hypothetical protein
VKFFLAFMAIAAWIAAIVFAARRLLHRHADHGLLLRRDQPGRGVNAGVACGLLIIGGGGLFVHEATTIGSPATFVAGLVIAGFGCVAVARWWGR